MRTVSWIRAVGLFGMVLAVGCESPGDTGGSTSRTTSPRRSKTATEREESRGAWTNKDGESTSGKPTADTRHQGINSEKQGRLVFTAENNPTSAAKRGTPSLDDKFRPSAWIFIDECDGHYVEANGQPHLEWVVDQPVSAKPTFRVEVYEPLLGRPTEFKSVLQTIDSPDGSTVSYGIAARDGTFKPGQTVSLLNPGDNFIIRNLFTGDVVKEIAPLPPGRYLLAGGIKNLQSGAETPAVTYFTVGDSDRR